MDVINLGIPLFHSAKTGIEASHESILNLDFEADNWLEVMGTVIESGPKLWREVALEQRKAAFHQNPKNRSLSRAMQRISKGHIWPKIEVSKSAFNQLDLKGQDFVNAISCNTKPEYKISTEIPYSHNSINVSYSDPNTINALESLQMAVYLADKYNNFSSLAFRKELGSTFDISVSRDPNQAPVIDGINLYMSSYTNNYLHDGKSLQYLKLREFISTLVYTLRYRVTRSSNIVRLKIALIYKTHFTKSNT
jgi:hypothetical protein